MKILVDGYDLSRPHGTGVATYGRGFIAAAQSLGHDVGVLFGVEKGSARLAEQGPPALRHLPASELTLSRRLSRIGGSLLAPLGHRASQLALPGEVDERIPGGVELWNAYGLFAHSIGAFRKLGVFSTVRVPGISVAHWTFPLPLRVEGAINLYTIHDLVPMLHPELTLDRPGRYERLCRAVAARADHILTVSENSRRDIIEHLGVEPERLTNIYQAHQVDAGQSASARRAAPAIATEYGLKPGHYFVFAGAIEPKKNVRRLLQAYFESGTRVPLIFAGTRGWGVEREMAPLLDRGDDPAAGQVRLIGYQSRARLSALISGARALLFPSLKEGFGLPAVEAMALGTPVLASNEGGLGEVVGDAALTIDPEDVASIAEAIRTLDDDPETRSRLSAAGLVRARNFAPDVYAKRVHKLLADLTDGKTTLGQSLNGLSK